jgi:hypothetical protein
MGNRVDDGLLITLKRVSAVLKQADVPFALGGGFAAYAHGGTSSDHDVDFLLREQDVEKALIALVQAGFTAERPPEDWLVKVYDDGRLVDLIHRPVERPVTDETLNDTVIRPVNAVHLPVVSATALMVHKLLTFLAALLRLRPWAAVGPLAAGADRLEPGMGGDGALTVRRGVSRPAGSAWRGPQLVAQARRPAARHRRAYTRQGCRPGCRDSAR